MKKVYIFIVIIFSIFISEKVNALDLASLQDVEFSSYPRQEYEGSCNITNTSSSTDYLECTFTHSFDYSSQNIKSDNHDMFILSIGSNGYLFTLNSDYRDDSMTSTDPVKITNFSSLDLINFGKPRIQVQATDTTFWPCEYDGTNVVCLFPRGKVVDEIIVDYVARVPKGTFFSGGAPISQGKLYYHFKIFALWTFANSSFNKIVDNTSNINKEQERTTEAVKENTQATKEVNNTLKDSSVDNQQAEGFFNDFNDNSHGLSGIITAPLNMINNLASATCTPITINIPFVDTEFNLPCMSTIYQQNFGNLFSIYRTITFGIVAYYVCVNIFALVKGFKDPENDKVEVVEL